MTRILLQVVITGVLVTCACSNLWRFTQNVSQLPPRQLDGPVVWENRLRGIRASLAAEHYAAGDVGYMPAGVLHGIPRTSQEDINWVLARYVMIPLNLRQDTLDAPYVIADTTGWKEPFKIPEGFVKVDDGNDGLLLLQRTNLR